MYAFPVNSIFEHVRECTHRLRHVGILAIAPLEELVMPAFFDFVRFICSFQSLDSMEKQLKDKVSPNTPPPASELERALAYVHAPSLISHPFFHALPRAH